jgi:FkbM family methyltransferase
VSVIQNAVASKDDSSIKLYLSKHGQGNNSMYAPEEAKSEELMKTITLDTFIQRNRLKEVDYIKIDVEGAELDVLQGAQRTLRVLKPVLIVEFNSAITALAGYDLTKLYRAITKFGYVGFTMSGEQATPR